MEQNGKSWKDLCAEAAVEKDPQRLTELIAEITRLIDAEQLKRSPRQNQKIG